jgi:hypothetical protein
MLENVVFMQQKCLDELQNNNTLCVNITHFKYFKFINEFQNKFQH